LLRRLEEQGLLQSQWDTGGSHPRRYYVISPKGEGLLKALALEWRQLARVLEDLLKEEG
jgi:DNA-binding PadR family transcriptional regulator